MGVVTVPNTQKISKPVIFPKYVAPVIRSMSRPSYLFQYAHPLHGIYQETVAGNCKLFTLSTCMSNPHSSLYNLKPVIFSDYEAPVAQNMSKPVIIPEHAGTITHNKLDPIHK